MFQDVINRSENSAHLRALADHIDRYFMDPTTFSALK